MRVVQADSLLEGSNHEFVVNIFIGILGRWPDDDGYRHYMAKVEASPDVRRELIREMAGSDEARHVGTEVVGLDGAPPPAPVPETLPTELPRTEAPAPVAPPDGVPASSEDLAETLRRTREELAALQTYVSTTLKRSLCDYVHEVVAAEAAAFEGRLRALEARFAPTPPNPAGR